MKSILRVVGGLDFDARQDRDENKSRAADRKRAAPLHREWLRRAEHHRMAGYLLPIDIMVARELLNYPSSNRGKCYAGRKRIADIIGANMRTVARALDRLEACGLLKSQRGGQGKTATRFFCCNGIYLFGGKAFLPLGESRLDGTPESHLDGTPESHKPSEQDQPLEQSLPQTPAQPHDVVITPRVTFAEFWQWSGRQGAEGFARSEWRKLSDDEMIEVTDHVRSASRADAGLWAGTFLRDRVWRDAKQGVDRGKSGTIADAVDRLIDDLEPKQPRYQHCAPGSALWRAERERKRAAGESTSQMDRWAREGKGVTVRVNSDGEVWS